MLKLNKKEFQRLQRTLNSKTLFATNNNNNNNNAIDIGNLTLLSKIIKKFYARATPHLQLLKNRAKIATASPYLDKINKGIKA